MPGGRSVRTPTVPRLGFTEMYGVLRNVAECDGVLQSVTEYDGVLRNVTETDVLLHSFEFI